jgi:hypothetical protein
MSENLLKLWENLVAGSFYKNWEWGGVVRGFFQKKGLFDSTPLHDFIKD